jgi:hypothetical protein
MILNILSSVGDVFFIYMLLLEPVFPKVSMWTILLKTPVINHMDIVRSSPWVPPDDSDIRRRNICQEVIVVNKKCISWWLCSYKILYFIPILLATAFNYKLIQLFL